MCGSASRRRASAPRCGRSWRGRRNGSAAGRLTSIFFGGGTPSLMEPETVAALIDDARRLFEPADDIEITLEANPDQRRSGALRGVPRRRGEPGLDRRAEPRSGGVAAARPAAFGGAGDRRAGDGAGDVPAHLVRPDLCAAWPDARAWRAELRQALALAADHLSLYQLTIEPGTEFEAMHRRGEIVLPDEDTGAALYEATAEEAARFGLLRLRGVELRGAGGESRHNLAYWRYGDYAGIGPGAHGRITLPSSFPRKREPEVHGTRQWSRQSAAHRHQAPSRAGTMGGTGRARRPRHCRGSPTGADRARARNAADGAAPDRGDRPGALLARTGVPLEAALDPSVLHQAIDEGYLAWRGTSLAATQAGRLRLDAMLAAIVR